MYIKFQTRIKSWSEAAVCEAIDVRKLKIEQAQRAQKKAQARRLNSELNTLSNRLVELRSRELWPIPAPDIAETHPANQNAA